MNSALRRLPELDAPAQWPERAFATLADSVVETSSEHDQSASAETDDSEKEVELETLRHQVADLEAQLAAVRSEFHEAATRAAEAFAAALCTLRD